MCIISGVSITYIAVSCNSPLPAPRASSDPFMILSHCNVFEFVPIGERDYESNFTHYQELLGEHENINVSESVIRTVLASKDILSPKARKKTKKALKQKLREQLEKPDLPNVDKEHIVNTIIAIEDTHPRRPRCAYFGELIQMDVSDHPWFGNFRSYLHIAIDDATGNLV